MNQRAEELDRVFSIFIRLFYSNHAGFVSCYTCGKRMTFHEAQNGHFLRRGHKAVRWDENNCRPQCASCNVDKNGMPEAFEENLRDELGDKAVDALIERGKEAVEYSDAWYVDKIKYYKVQILRMGGKIT